MAISIEGASLNNIKNTTYSNRDMHDINNENYKNIVQIVLQNNYASYSSIRTISDVYPDMRQMEYDLCTRV